MLMNIEFTKSIIAYQVTWDILVCACKSINNKGAVTGATIWLILQWSTNTKLDPYYFQQNPNNEIQKDCVNTHYHFIIRV